MILKWLFWSPFDIFVKIIGVLLAPFFSLFVDENGDLPDCLFWFQTPDSNMFGMYGDAGFYSEHKDDTHTWLGRWWVCTLWQWRNTSQGFSTFAIGLDDSELPLETIFEKERIYLKLVRKDGKRYGFDFKGSLKYPFINFRLRWRFGWKLHQEPKYPSQYVFSISPFISND